MKWLLLTTVLLTGCVQPGPVLPAPEGDDLTARATEACTRKMAQMAASYKALSVASRVEDAHPLPTGRFVVVLKTIIVYTTETRTGSVNCIVTKSGSVEAID